MSSFYKKMFPKLIGPYSPISNKKRAWGNSIFLPPKLLAISMNRCHTDCCVAVRCGEKISSQRLSPFSWHLQISLGSPLDPATEDLFASVFLARRSLEAQKPSPAEPPSLAGC